MQDSLATIIADALRADPATDVQRVIAATGLRRAIWATLNEGQRRAVVRKAKQIAKEPPHD
jgi:acyl-CoA reductase-like NAD-dependent aldehyde dehydrogenase